MNDAIYGYVKSRLRHSLEGCKWEDRVGQLFETISFEGLLKSLERIQGETADVLDFVKQAEREIKT